MSRLVYATQIRCDWPAGCDVTGTIPWDGKDQWRPPPPEGWASFNIGPSKIDGAYVNDLCPEHAARSVRDLAEVLNEHAAV